jgi:hypothetical protein
LWVTTPSPVDMDLAICHWSCYQEVGMIFGISKIHCGEAFDPPSLIWCRGFYVQNILLTWISWHNCFVCGNITNDLFCNPQARILISANIIYLQSKALQSVFVNKTIILLFINMQTNKELMTWSSLVCMTDFLHLLESLPLSHYLPLGFQSPQLPLFID